MEGIGREIENRVTGNDSSRVKDEGLKAESASATSYGSPEHHAEFAESLESTGANETQIRGRLAAARSEGTSPRSGNHGQGRSKGPKVPHRGSGGGKRQERPQPVGSQRNWQ
jgi:hypothetical protein